MHVLLRGNIVSEFVPYRLVVERDIMVKMRDGVSLACDVYHPEGHRRCPVLLGRTPYDKGPTLRSSSGIPYSPFQYLNPVRAASRGYVVIVQDVRGRWKSEGTFYPFLHEAEDGYDTIQWASKLPYSNGFVGMFGGSYLGATQWLALMGNPPALKAIIPLQTSSRFYDVWAYEGGTFRLGALLPWALELSLETAARLPKNQQARIRAQIQNGLENLDAGFRVRPLGRYSNLRKTAPYYYDWLRHPRLDEYWERWDFERNYRGNGCAVLHIGGWYDPFIKNTIRDFESMSRLFGSERNRLVVGPWSHFPPYVIRLGELDFGREAYLDLDYLQLRWFDRWLKQGNKNDGDPTVEVFVMGARKWRRERSWPIPRTTTSLFLHGPTKQHSVGELSQTPPRSYESPSTYVYDPRNPFPSRESSMSGPSYQEALNGRKDFLRYQSGPLKQAVEIAGSISMSLFVSTSAKDTDFVGRLVDVSQDGSSQNLSSGVLRMCYRHSRAEASPVSANQIYEIQLNLGAICNRFNRNHQIGLQITSSDFPDHDNNLNTGEELVDAFNLQKAKQVVYHDAQHPSRLILPVVRSP